MVERPHTPVGIGLQRLVMREDKEHVKSIERGASVFLSVSVVWKISDECLLGYFVEITHRLGKAV